MMPKGVEHSEIEAGGLGALEVRIPMMPKGVEHAYKTGMEKQEGCV